MKSSFPVLVVDDDVVSRTVIEKHLKKAGFTVSTVPDGRHALRQFDETFYPIVLTDWMMPEIDGPQLCRLIREKETNGYVFIILVTGRDKKTDTVVGLEAGADDYLTKPIHPAELIARINTGIRILRLEQSLKKANEEIRQLSITDPLTGCFNRSYLNDRFPQELGRASRYKRPLSVVLADIDNFKTVNDSYGHQAGDEVLKCYAGCILNQIRKKIDWVVRYGGEEFLIILPETGLSGAHTMAQRLREKIAKKCISVGNATLNITSSFGGASVAFDNQPTNILMQRLINRADENLYQSKREGRNRVTVTHYFERPG